MKYVVMQVVALSLLLGLFSTAHADEFWAVYADSTFAGQSGYLVLIADEEGFGETMFVSTEQGHRRLLASRPFGESNWDLFPEGSYIAPGPDDSIGDSWTTVPDDFDRPSRSYFEAIESFDGPLGIMTAARCVVRPDEAPETFTEVRHFVDGVGLISDHWPGDGTDLLVSFSIVGGTGYLPLAVGNTWFYAFDELNMSAADQVPLSQNMLHACAPNPFNPQTEISFEMGAGDHASLKIFDAAGHLIKILVDEQRVAGLHTVKWDGRDNTGRMAAAGVYLYRFEAGESVQTRRMTLVK